MVCYYVAQAQAQIETESTAELLRSPEALAVLAQQLARLLNQPAAAVVVDRAGPELVYLRAPGPTRLTIRAGSIWGESYSLPRIQVDALVAQITQIAEQLAGPLVQERAVQAIRETYGAYAITGDQRVGAARVVKVRIPL